MHLTPNDIAHYFHQSGVVTEIYGDQNPDGRGITQLHHHFWTYSAGKLTIGLDPQLMTLVERQDPHSGERRANMVRHAVDGVLHQLAEALEIRGQLHKAIIEVVVLTEGNVVFAGQVRETVAERLGIEAVWGECAAKWSVGQSDNPVLHHRSWSLKRRLPNLILLPFDITTVASTFSSTDPSSVKLIMNPTERVPDGGDFRFEIDFVVFGRDTPDFHFELRVSYYGNFTPYLGHSMLVFAQGRQEKALHLLHSALVKACKTALLVGEQHTFFNSKDCSGVTLASEDAITKEYLQTSEYKRLLQTLKGD